MKPKSNRNPGKRLLQIIIAGSLSLSAAHAQQAPANVTTPAAPASPAPKKELPPLNLPDIPGEDKLLPELDNKDEKIVPAAPIPSLPIPPGPAVVKSGLTQNQAQLYRIEYDGKLVGYSRFVVSGQMSLGGESSYIINSQAKLVLGKGPNDVSNYDSKLIIDSKTLIPNFFRVLQLGKDVAPPAKKEPLMVMECLYSNTLVAQKNHVGKLTLGHFHSYEGETPRLLCNNLWGHLDTFPEHYWLLVRSAIHGGSLPAYDPILRGGGTLTVYAPKKESWKWENRTLDTLVYPISDLEGVLLAYVRVTANTYDLLEVNEVGRGVTMTRTQNAKLMAEVDKLKGIDLQTRRTAPSNVLFTEPEKLTALEADIDMDLRGGQFADHRVLGYRQYFTGENREGLMKGRVVVRSVPRESQYTTKYPFRTTDKPSAEIANYLKPSPGVESDFVPLRNKALELAWKSENTFQAARKLMNYASQVEEGSSLPSARYAFESNAGNPESKALLLVAMSRGTGIPARHIGGLLNRDNVFVPHHWAELWLGPAEGWVPFDPTTQEAGRVGASHIALWESGDVQRLELKVTNYAPRAPKRVAHFERDLTWGIGEERTYEVLRDGQKVGEETAAVREVVVQDGEDYFRFETNTKLVFGEKTIENHGDMLLDGQGLPASFVIKNNENPVPLQSYSFKEDATYLETEKAGTKNVREIPFSHGTYFADQRFLTQWALILGQAQLPSAKNSSMGLNLPPIKSASSMPSMPAQALKPGDRVGCMVFVPELLKNQEINFDVKESEPIKLADGTEVDVVLVESEAGMKFYLNKQNQVVKIEVPKQKLELILKEIKFKV
jgi:transglutaminase-like putative cysteine protease